MGIGHTFSHSYKDSEQACSLTNLERVIKQDFTMNFPVKLGTEF